MKKTHKVKAKTEKEAKSKAKKMHKDDFRGIKVKKGKKNNYNVTIV